MLMEIYPIEPDAASHLTTSHGDRSWPVFVCPLCSANRPLPSLPILEAELGAEIATPRVQKPLAYRKTKFLNGRGRNSLT